MVDEGKRSSRAHEVGLFFAWRQGNVEAGNELDARLYEELRRLAARHLGSEGSSHTLQPTALVNETFLRLMGADLRPNDRSHLFALASRTMRRVLIDHARRHLAGKRFSSRDRVTLVTDIGTVRQEDVDVLDLHEALERFSRVSPRAAEVVEMRYFGGMTQNEIAEVLSVSPRTVERDWTGARLWLRRELGA